MRLLNSKLLLRIFLLFFVSLFLLLISCEKGAERKDSTFVLLTADKTGLNFENKLTHSANFSVFDYMYFYNGGGIAAADFNNDGLVDLFFTSNMGENKLFLNRGDFKFEDVTVLAGVAGNGEWATGASVVDINNDGLIDIYVSVVGDHKDLKGTNLLFICKEIKDGIPIFENQAIAYDLDLAGYGTQAVFYDYDKDGDLDMFMLNHSVHANGTFGRKEDFSNNVSITAGDKLFKNENGTFLNISKEAGIFSSVIGYGLGVAVADINNNGFSDIYVGNDFHEDDYLYINNGEGKYKESLSEQIQHTSRFTMGVDIADINNDGWNDIFTLDMLPYDRKILKSSLGEDPFDIYYFKKDFGYGEQYSRNNLQLNNTDNSFSEIAMFAGIEATDWSWSSLFVDFNNNGHKDLFVSNGIPRRVNDIDYINFMQENYERRIRTEMGYTEESDLEIIDNMPRIKIPNMFFANNGDLSFREITNSVAGNQNSYSNGAVFVDLDNDGDLDIVVNNLEDKPFIYKNLSVEKGVSGDAIILNLKGSPENRNAIGARFIAFLKNGGIISYENFPVRGFQSSALTNFHVGIGDRAEVKEMFLIWPNGGYQTISNPKYGAVDTLKWKENLPKFDYGSLNRAKTNSVVVKQDSFKVAGKLSHKENRFPEFGRDPLIPFTTSSEGPAIAIGDINGDGLDDFFIGSAKTFESELYVQNPDGSFIKLPVDILEKDKQFEDVYAKFADFDNDGHLDLIVASGGNEYGPYSEYLEHRIYFNNGEGSFAEKIHLPGVSAVAGALCLADFNGDGWVDIFIGSRVAPRNYGERPESFLIQNKGNRQFEVVTDVLAPQLKDAGMVRDAKWHDFNGDGKPDLVVAAEWETVKIYTNRGSSFEEREISSDKGWWKSISIYDFNQDGKDDILLGNHGLNSRLRPSTEHPVRMYVNDFNKSGKNEQILTYYIQNEETTFVSYGEIMKQMPHLKKKFLFAKDFAKASIKEIYGNKAIEDAILYEVNTFANKIFFNDGNGKFNAEVLPNVLQLSSIHIVYEIGNINGYFVGGNDHGNNLELGKNDADYGNILYFQDGRIRSERPKGLKIIGEIKNANKIVIQEKEFILIGINNQAPILLHIAEKKNGENSEIANIP